MASLSFRTSDSSSLSVTYTVPEIGNGNYDDLLLPIVTSDATGGVLPAVSNSSLGSSSNMWSKAFIKSLTVTTTQTSSDARLKTDVEPFKKADFKQIVKELKGKLVSFHLQDDTETLHHGFIAQEIMEVFEKYGMSAEDLGIVTKNDAGFWMINYPELLLIMLCA